MKNKTITLFVMASLGLALAFLPQQAVHAKTCYDSNKERIPCPKSGYVLTQEAKKNIAPTATDAPTDTPTNTPTPTDTPTDTPTSSPTPTDTPEPTKTQAAALVVPPVTANTQPNACDPGIWPEAAGAGILLAVPGALLTVIRQRTVGGARGFVGPNYAPESAANQSSLGVHVGKVDFGGEAGGPNALPAAPVGLAIAGLSLVVASAAGILNIIPCSAGIPVAGGSVLAGLLAAAGALVFGRGGMRLFFSGRLKVTGNQRLARKLQDDLDQEK